MRAYLVVMTALPNIHPAPCRYASTDELPVAQVPVVCLPLRYGLMAFGCINVGLGVVGLVLPVMPTTVFLLIALWAFSKCSLRFHRWLYDHPRLGRPLRDWHTNRAIPRRAKLLALTMMGISWLIVTLLIPEGWLLPFIIAACLAPVAAFIVTRQSRISA